MVYNHLKRKLVSFSVQLRKDECLDHLLEYVLAERNSLVKNQVKSGLLLTNTLTRVDSNQWKSYINRWLKW